MRRMRLKWLRPWDQACAMVRVPIASVPTPAPVPGFVHDAVRVVERVAHDETVCARVVPQPGEGARLFEALFRRRFVRRADVECATAVVFAETGRGIDLEDLLHPLPARELPFEDAQLVIVRAIAADGFEDDVAAHRIGLHVLPGARGIGQEPERAAIAIEAGEAE